MIPQKITPLLLVMTSLSASRLMDEGVRPFCMASFGKFTGDELENESCTPAESAEDCQAHCAATEGCSFFAFKAHENKTVTVSCGQHTAVG